MENQKISVSENPQLPALPVGVLSMFIVELHIELAHTNPAENHLGMAEAQKLSLIDGSIVDPKPFAWTGSC